MKELVLEFPNDKTALYSLGALYHNEALHLLDSAKDENLGDKQLKVYQDKAARYLKLYEQIREKYNNLNKDSIE